MTFDEYFNTATSGTTPHEYQSRLGPYCDGDGFGPSSLAISAPTGAGKTAAVIVTWLFNRCFSRQMNCKSKWPLRLVYCLPMRSLVSQTCVAADTWLRNLKKAELIHNDVAAYTLMGGNVQEGWELQPEAPAILIGTQDQLLSRALNRGYAMSRRRWPMHFGLLNNDCLWVLDEVQLMGPGLATALQLEAFRSDAIAGKKYFGTERKGVYIIFVA